MKKIIKIGTFESLEYDTNLQVLNLKLLLSDKSLLNIKNIDILKTVDWVVKLDLIQLKEFLDNNDYTFAGELVSIEYQYYIFNFTINTTYNIEV